MKKVTKATGLLIAALLLIFKTNHSTAQMVASGSNSNASFFMCTVPGHPQASGDNSSGQLGNGTTTNIEWPLPIGGISTIATVSSGPTHTLYLQSNGAVYACGSNAYGQLGIGSTFDSPNLVQVVGLSNVIDIAAGSNFSLFLLSDSSVWACGYNANGQLGDGTTINRTFPVKVHGVQNVGFLSGIVAIAAGSNHSLFIKRESNGDRRALGCGSNLQGQLALIDTTMFSSLTPNYCSVGSPASWNVSAISAGNNFSLFLNNDTAWASGNNAYGQLGDNTMINRYSAIKVRGANNVGFLSGIRAIAAGSSHALFVKSDSTAWACGRNDYGNLGDKTLFQRNVPVQVQDIYGQFLTGCIDVAGGANHSLFIKGNNTIWSCGRNNVGQLGNGYSGFDLNFAYPLFKFSGWPTITGGPVFNGSGDLYASGFYSNFLWSNGSTLPYTTVSSSGTYSVTVTDAYGCTGSTSQQVIVNSQSIASGSSSNSSYIMCSSPGNPKVTGNNLYGQLGNGDTLNQNSIVGVSSLSNIKMISGSAHTLFLKDDKTVWASGLNSAGQLGDLTTTNRKTPVQVSGLTNVTAVAAGGNHSLFLKSDGFVRACGLNSSGQLGDSTTTSRSITMVVQGIAGITAIAAGKDFSLFLDNRGVVYACGKNDVGQLGQYFLNGDELLPTWVLNVAGEVIAIAAGEKHSLFLMKDGTVYSTGSNQYGQLGDNTLVNKSYPTQIAGLTGVVAISAGANHSMFLKSDGTVWACGLNSSGQLGDNSFTNRKIPVLASTLTGIKAIAGGSNHSLFIKSDGTIWSTGKNDSGQLGDITNINKKKAVQVLLAPSVPTISASVNPLCKGSSTTLSIASGSLRGATAWKWYTGSCGGTLAGTGNSISVTPTKNTKYYVRGEGGCQALGTCANIVITVNVLPVVTVTPVTDTICPPTTSKLLTALGASTYNWFPSTGLNQITGPAVLAGPAATTTYTVVGTDVNGCSATKTVKVVVKPVPGNLTTTNITTSSALASWSHISCAVGYTIQYRVSTSSSWTTLQINSNTNSVVAGGLIPSTTYNWKVRTKFANGTNSAYSAQKSFTTPALRAGELAADDNLNVYPNPSTGMVNLLITDCDHCSVQLLVFDMLGNRVYDQQYNADGQNKTIDLSTLAKGVYQLQVRYDGVTKKSKLILQ